MRETIIHDSKKMENSLIELRRKLHKYPEIGGELPLTRKIVCEWLDEREIPYVLNNEDDGLVATIKGFAQGKTIAFRGDMDGLHIQEETLSTYHSEIEGQMHACGHDAHTAMLLVAADILNKRKESLHGTVKLLFQSGEETGTGAKHMLNNGALDGVDAVCALHVGNLAGDNHQAGDMVVLSGPVSSGKNKFTITVHGKGTHSAFPEKGVDPILVAARIVNACEEIAARELPAGTAAVLSFGSFQAGEDHNTIPSTAVLKGSIRVQDELQRNMLGERLTEISNHISEAFRAKCDVNIIKGSQTIINDATLSEFVSETLTELLGEEKVFTKSPCALMGSDDFANYASLIPAVYFFLHTNNQDLGIIESNHNPNFNLDESVLWEGVAAFVAIAENYLK